MGCKCVPCDECDGTGTVWFSFSGEYLGNNHCDDLDELDTCEECGGSGIAELCSECREYEERYEEEQWLRYERERKPQPDDP